MNKNKFKKLFSNKIIIITGGISGIGSAIYSMLNNYAYIVIADINENKAVLSANTDFISTDISDAYAVKALYQFTLQKYGRIDYIFNCAAITIAGEIVDTDISDWDTLININLKGTINSSLIAYKIMAGQKSGHIINLASASGLFIQPIASIYTTTKFGIVGFTQCLMAEAADLGVNVSLVCPSYIKTGLYDHMKTIRVDKKLLLSKLPFKMMDKEKAAIKILKGVMKKKRLIIFPFEAVLFWFFFRLFPGLAQLIGRLAMKSFRKIKTE